MLLMETFEISLEVLEHIITLILPIQTVISRLALLIHSVYNAILQSTQLLTALVSVQLEHVLMEHISIPLLESVSDAILHVLPVQALVQVLVYPALQVTPYCLVLIASQLVLQDLPKAMVNVSVMQAVQDALTIQQQEMPNVQAASWLILLFTQI